MVAWRPCKSPDVSQPAAADGHGVGEKPRPNLERCSLFVLGVGEKPRPNLERCSLFVLGGKLGTESQASGFGGRIVNYHPGIGTAPAPLVGWCSLCRVATGRPIHADRSVLGLGGRIYHATLVRRCRTENQTGEIEADLADIAADGTSVLRIQGDAIDLARTNGFPRDHE